MPKFVFFKAPNLPAKKDIVSFLSERAYSDERGSGFIIEDIKNSHIYGKFIVRQENERLFENPFGESFSETFIQYHSCGFHFNLSSDINIQIIDPPRLLKPFFRELIDLVGIDRPLTKITFNIKSLLQYLKSCSILINTTSMEFHQISIMQKAIGKLVVRGENDVYAVSKQYLKDQDYLIENINSKLTIGPRSGNISVNSSGTIFIDDVLANVLLEILYEYFVQCP